MESYRGYRRTNLITFPYGRGARRVYEKDGKLYYRSNNFWAGTFREYCIEYEPAR